MGSLDQLASVQMADFSLGVSHLVTQYVCPFLSGSNRTANFFGTIEAFGRGISVLLRRKKLFCRSLGEKSVPSSRDICRNSSVKDILLHIFR